MSGCCCPVVKLPSAGWSFVSSRLLACPAAARQPFLPPTTTSSTPIFLSSPNVHTSSNDKRQSLNCNKEECTAAVNGDGSGTRMRKRCVSASSAGSGWDNHSNQGTDAMTATATATAMLNGRVGRRELVSWSRLDGASDAVSQSPILLYAPRRPTPVC